jgi:hypothetical protein
MSVRPFPLGQHLGAGRFNADHALFKARYPDNAAVRAATLEYAARRLDITDIQLPSYLIYLSLWNDNPAQRRAAGNLAYHLNDVAATHIGKSIMVVESGSLATVNDGLASVRSGRKLPEEVSIRVGRVRRPTEGESIASNLKFSASVLKTSPHPRLAIPSPSMSFETSLLITNGQRLTVDTFGRTTIKTDKPNETAEPVLMLEGGAPLRLTEDYQAGRQLQQHEFVIGNHDSFALVRLLYELHNRRNMDGFADQGMRDYMATPDLNPVFA